MGNRDLRKQRPRSAPLQAIHVSGRELYAAGVAAARGGLCACAVGRGTGGPLAAAGHGWKNFAAADGTGSGGRISQDFSAVGRRATARRGACRAILTLGTVGGTPAICLSAQKRARRGFCQTHPPSEPKIARRNGRCSSSVLRLNGVRRISANCCKVPSLGVRCWLARKSMVCWGS